MEDRCPGVLRLHAAADGHLLRVRLPGGHLSAAASEAIADLARLGNGLVELTSRASVQVRGLRPGDASAAAERLTAGGLLPSPVHDRVRNVLASPLGGRVDGALLDTDPLVTAIDAAICQDPTLAALPGRFLFALEDGSGILGGGQGDVTLAAEAHRASGVRLRLHLAGRPTTRTAAPDQAADLALESARAFLEVLGITSERSDRALWRVRDLAAEDLDRLLGRLDTGFTAGSSLGNGRPPALGAVRQPDGRHAVTALAPLGRLYADTADGLAAIAASSGGRIRVSPWRTITMVDVRGTQLTGVSDAIRELGLVLDGASGWRNLSACAGLGACANAQIDVRAAATLRASVRGAAGSSAVEHWSACERRCGRPAVVAHAVTATSTGI